MTSKRSIERRLEAMEVQYNVDGPGLNLIAPACALREPSVEAADEDGLISHSAAGLYLLLEGTDAAAHVRENASRDR